MSKYFNYDSEGKLIGGSEQPIAGFENTEVDPKGIKNATWDGKGWVSGKEPVPYADFADFGFSSELDYAIASANTQLAGAQVQIANGIPLEVTLEATAETVVFAGGGKPDQKKLDAFTEAMNKRTGALDDLTVIKATLTTKVTLAEVETCRADIRNLLAS